MADDEQFSLCWNNFNSNLSAGFHESLCRGDLVDVTLAAEGQFVKAHRLVLSVCSPYFRKMFTQMPANQHAFVFLKDVSHTALKDLIQFMYCGEVNVKQEALPAFISTAEALQIKGLTDSDPPQSQTPPEPSTPTPPQIQQIATSPRVRQRTSTSRSYKIETVDDSGEEQKQQPTQIVIQTTAAPPQATIVHHAPQQQQQQHIQTAQATQQQIVTAAPTTTTTTVLTQKRPAQRSIGSSAPHIKRTKSTIETIVDTSNEAAQQNVQVQQQPQQITVQAAVVTTDKSGHQQAETEYIDLPIDLPTKSEPEYADEAGDVEGDHEGTYVEDDAYADIRYDESYFTENEDGGNNVSSGTTTVSTGGGNSTATTSKAVIKQQQSSFSDSTYVDGGAGDQGNNDAQARKSEESPSYITDDNIDDVLQVPTKLPLILDGRFYNNIKPNMKTPGGITATCTSCFNKISGTTKSTGNFLSHIKRRHKEILHACQLHCQGKTSQGSSSSSACQIQIVPSSQRTLKPEDVLDLQSDHFQQIKLLQPFKLPILSQQQQTLQQALLPTPVAYEIRQVSN